GLAAAAALAQAGAEVILAARSATELEAAAAALESSGGKASTLVLDVTRTAEATDRIFNAGRIDILCNNAGTNRPKPVWDVTEEDFDAVVDLNLKASFFVARAAAKNMIAHKVKGVLIHMGSQMGHVGGVNRSLYCASKWGLEGLSKALALDLASHGIRSNTIAPTFIETPMTRPFFENAEFLQSVLSRIKLGRLGQETDIMGAIVFLASDAAALMTGTSLVIDGGWTAD
ncbi:SDR family oxidoreductase, partial [Rhizobium sp.]|uniref:SDR family NAD(P)-dependent oxidoreductase n=1 Tax=Rhizobium sp. TaxID=391 RepID=UPI000E986852|nr:3-oxoacyl-ACP reductase [Rhizobium sp.]